MGILDLVLPCNTSHLCKCTQLLYRCIVPNNGMRSLRNFPNASYLSISLRSPGIPTIFVTRQLTVNIFPLLCLADI